MVVPVVTEVPEVMVAMVVVAGRVQVGTSITAETVERELKAVREVAAPEVWGAHRWACYTKTRKWR